MKGAKTTSSCDPQASPGLISIVLPVHDEAESIVPCLMGLWKVLENVSYEILVCYDRDEDTTLPAINTMKRRPPSVRLVRNNLGPGLANALRAGFREAKGDVVVTTMPDLSDEPRAIPLMAEKVRAGAAVVSGSRYTRGGRQIGGPRLKRLLSRMASSCLDRFAGLGTCDATTNFRAYSADYLRKIDVESRHGFEVALELTVKAHSMGLRVDEAPATRQDRSAGQGRFSIWKRMPSYLRWFSQGMAPAAFVWATFALLLIAGIHMVWTYSMAMPQGDEWAYPPVVTGNQPITLSWLWEQHGDHRVPIPKAIYVAVNRLTGYNAAVLNTIDFLLLGAASLLLVLTIRRLRGRLEYTDSFFPLLLMNWGQWETFIMPWNITFAMPCFFTVAVICLVALSTRLRTRTLAAWMGPCLVPLCVLGSLGAFVVLLVSPWLAWVGIKAWRRKENPDRVGGGLAVGFAAAAYCLIGACLMGYHDPGGREGGTTADAIGVATQVLCVSLGEAAGAFWPFASYLVAGIVAAAGALLLHTFLRRQPERMRSGGLLLLVLAFLAVASAIGVGRACLGAANRSGLVSRYSALTCGVLAVVYLAMELYAWRGVGVLVKVLLATAAWAFLWHNTESGIWLMKNRLAVIDHVRKDIQRNVPIPELARRYVSALWTVQEPEIYIPKLESRLTMLARARISIFRDLPPPDGRWDHMATLSKNLQRQPGPLVDLPDGRLGLVTFTPSRTFLPLPPRARNVVVGFAIPADTYTRGNRTAGVQFRILVGHDWGPEDVVFSRHLDPMANPADRQEYLAAIPLATGRPPTRLILETQDPASGGGRQVSLWTRVEVGAEP